MSKDEALVREMERAIDRLWKWLLISYGACASVIITLATLRVPAPAVIAFGVACWAPWIGAAADSRAAIQRVKDGRARDGNRNGGDACGSGRSLTAQSEGCAQDPSPTIPGEE